MGEYCPTVSPHSSRVLNLRGTDNGVSRSQSTLHQLAAKSHAREESDASAKGHGTHVFSSGDAGRAEEDAAAKEREREREFREVVKKIGKKEGKEEVEKREERAKRQGEEAKRQAVALRMQRPDTPVRERVCILRGEVWC
eukprot:15330-Rhodomonas_salina.3